MKIAYWVVTGLFALMMAAGGVMDATHAQSMIEGVHLHMGYPEYVLSILGTAKLLGVPSLLAKPLPRLQEWAYAGFTVNLIGAAWSHLASGDGVGGAFPALFLLVVLAASYGLREAAGFAKPHAA